MGFLDLFRRKPADPTDAVRRRFGRRVVGRFRAFDERLATASLCLAGTPPFEWVEGSYSQGPIAGSIAMLWTGSEVVRVMGVDGLRALPAARARTKLRYR